MPETLKELLFADVQRGQRLIVRIQDEIDPQWRIATPSGDYHIVTTLPNETGERLRLLGRIGQLMDFKQAVGFTLVSELGDPDRLMGLGVTRTETAICTASIRRTPKPWTLEHFGEPEWLPPASADPMLTGLLPRGAASLSPSDVAALEFLFGEDGMYPLVHLETKRLGLA